MATRTSHSGRRERSVLDLVLQAFWVVAVGLVTLYIFFAVLGAYSPADITGVSLAVGGLLLLAAVYYGIQARRRRERGRDRREIEARERRGF
jgi:uncharacterized membrane protein YbhN (UPF0104 family)